MLDLDSNPLYVIEPPSDPKYYNNNYKILSEIDLQYHVKSTKITCYNLEHNIIYIGADGFVFPCGWLHDRFYGVETANTNDYILIRNMMESVGGPDMANCFHTSLQDIVDGPWFRCIQNSWHKQRLERCALICGEKINLIKEQNEFINYKS